MAMVNVPEQYVHPTTKEVVVSFVYENKLNPGQRGAYIGTASEFKGIYFIFQDWNFRYCATANPDMWRIYKENGYKALWGQELAGAYTKLRKQDVPQIKHTFTRDAIFCDRYTLDKDSGRSMIVISIAPEPRMTSKGTFMGRIVAPDPMKQKFLDNGYQDIIIEYQYHDSPWLEL